MARSLIPAANWMEWTATSPEDYIVCLFLKVGSVH